MQISNNGIEFLKLQEGEKLSAYKDTRGIPTIGVGHTGLVDGKPVAMGVTISKRNHPTCCALTCSGLSELSTRRMSR